MQIRQTEEIAWVGVIRVFLGVMFFSTGIMKLLFPMLGDAWSGQLIAANIPFYSFNVVFIPNLEIFLGVVLLAGTYSRVAALTIIPMMVVASYVHIVVDDPGLFPLQPEAPVIPLMVSVLAVVIIIKGGGAWSQDLQLSAKANGDMRK